MSLGFAQAKERRIDNSPKGFEQQWKPFFKAYKSSDPRQVKSYLDAFAIPDNWFTDVFGADAGPELAKLYADQFQDFESHIPRSLGLSMNLVGKHYGAGLNDLVIQTELADNPDPKPAPKPPPASLQPLPPVLRFSTKTSFHIQGTNQPGASWMDSFVYLDGRFRFLGRGAYPFWDAANVRRADPCAKPGEQTGGQLVTKVDPVYPEEAKQKGVSGVVRVRVTVATDGSVKEVEIIEGDPLLIDAAKQAILKWQYTPFMTCGQPVEMRSIEHVKFSSQ
jgi:TonB family protein